MIIFERTTDGIAINIRNEAEGYALQSNEFEESGGPLDGVSRFHTSAGTTFLEWQNLRKERDRRLSLSDALWIEKKSQSLSTTIVETYKQDLRNLPANTTDPHNPTWPTKPT